MAALVAGFAISMVLVLFGMAFMYGKYNIKINGINHTVNIGGYIERRNLVLHGLQCIGIGAGVLLTTIGFYLNHNGLRCLAVVAFIMSCLMAYLLKGKLKTHASDEKKSKPVHKAISIIIGYFLFYIGFSVLRKAEELFGISIPDEVSILAFIYTVFGGILAVVALKCVYGIVTGNHIITTLNKTNDPDEKIRLIDRAIKRKWPNPLKKTGEMREIACEAKVGFLYQAAYVYISKEDYPSALNRITEARTMFEYLSKDRTLPTIGLRYDEMCVLAESICMSNMGDYDYAERLFAPFMYRLEKMEDIGVILAMCACFEYAVCINDAQTARKVVTYIQPVLERLEKKFGSEARSDFLLMDGITDMMEGMNEEGTRKLTYVINNTKDYGNLRRAKKILNYL